MSSGGEARPWPEDPRERLVRLAHDLRSPLVVVSGFAELLVTKGDALPAEQREEFLGRLLEGARDMQAILDSERDARPEPPA